jgi:hypothetical protein
MAEYYKFIHDETELRWFYDHCIYPLERDESFFISLAARNKALTEEERKYYNLGRTEMYGKCVIRHDDWNSIIKHIRRYECNKEGYLTKNNVPYPEKCITVYWNINPSNVRQVIHEEQLKILELQDELVNSSLKGSKDGIDSAFYKLRKIFDTTISLYARHRGTYHWMDFDLDVDKEQLAANIERIHDVMADKVGKGNFVMIDTKGGMHIMVRKAVIKFNPNEIIMVLQEIFPDNKEIIKNDNEMIPLVGTIQGGYNVTVLNKDDFTEIIQRPQKQMFKELTSKQDV